MSPDSDCPNHYESITVAIPTCNEEGTLEAVVNECITFFRGMPGIDHEVLIIDDGSSDRSLEIAKRLAETHPTVRFYRHPTTRGFSAAQRSAYEHASKEWIFILPADGQIRVEELSKFMPLCKDADLILGRRSIRLEPFSKVVLSRMYYWLVGILFGISYSDYGACWIVRRRLC